MFEALAAGQGMSSPFDQIPGLESALAERGVSVDDLRKALAAGTPHPGSSPGNMAPIIPEDISDAMTSTTFTDEHLSPLREFPSEEATQLVHQYSRITAWGSPVSPWVNDGDLPSVDSDPTFDRPFLTLKPAVELGAVNVVSNLVKLLPGAPANLLALSKQSKMKAMASKLIPAMFFGDPTIDAKIMQGIIPQLVAGAPDNVIDLRGATLEHKHLDYAAEKIMNAFGGVDVAYMSAGVQRALAAASASPHLRVNRNDGAKGQPGTVGAVAESALTVAGLVPFKASPFFKPGGATQSGGIYLQNGKPLAAGYGASKPAAPVITSQTPAADASSQFVAADAGNYYYQIVACGPAGWSVPTAGAVVAIAKGEKCSILLNDAAVTGVTYYQVFRTRTKGLLSADAQWMCDVVKAAAGNTTIVDLNANIPGTSYAIMLKRSIDVVSQVYLGKAFVELDLGMLTDLRYRHVLLTVRGMALKVPTRVVAFKNCAEPQAADL